MAISILIMAFWQRYIKYSDAKLQIIDDKLMSSLTKIKIGHLVGSREYNIYYAQKVVKYNSII